MHRAFLLLDEIEGEVPPPRLTTHGEPAGGPSGQAPRPRSVRGGHRDEVDRMWAVCQIGASIQPLDPKIASVGHAVVNGTKPPEEHCESGVAIAYESEE